MCMCVCFTLQGIELLPYHLLGKNKWEELGMAYPLEGVPTPTSESVRNAIEKMTAAGLRVICNP